MQVYFVHVHIYWNWMFFLYSRYYFMYNKLGGKRDDGGEREREGGGTPSRKRAHDGISAHPPLWAQKVCLLKYVPMCSCP